MAIRVQITPEMRKRAALVKPGWYPVLLKNIYEELNKNKDGMNIIVDAECADNESEFYGVPVKCWLSEKAANFAGNLTSFIGAFNPKADPNATLDPNVEDYIGRYIFGKFDQSRGRDGNDPPQNRIIDWAPLPKKYAKLAEAKADVTPDVASFENA